MPPPYPRPASTVLTARQIATLVNNHNWFPDWKTNPAARKNFDTAIAVALAESSGDLSAKNGEHYGLYQISYPAHKDLFDVPSDPTVAGMGMRDPYDADDNVNMAQAVFKQAGNSWRPWQAYTTGAYSKYMDKAHAAAEPLVSISNGGADDSNFIDKGLTKGKNAVNSVANTIGNAIQSVLKFLVDAGITVGAFILAVLLIVLGIWLMIKDTAAGEKIKDTATTAATAAAMA